MSDPLARLAELGLALPTPPPPMASYVPARTVEVGGGRVLVFVAGQVPTRDGQILHRGRVPDQVGMEEAQAAARLCALNILAQVHAAVGLDNVESIAQLNGFVHCATGFGQEPQVINAASELLAQVLGEAGRHSRAAVGTASLPAGVPVEISAVVVARAGQ